MKEFLLLIVIAGGILGLSFYKWVDSLEKDDSTEHLINSEINWDI